MIELRVSEPVAGFAEIGEKNEFENLISQFVNSPVRPLWLAA